MAFCAGAATSQFDKNPELLLFVAGDVYSGKSASNSGNGVLAAEQVFDKARVAAQEGHISAALRWASRTLSVDPDHAAARRLLGYRLLESHWAGGYAGRRLEQGESWHQEFGWIRSSDLHRWNAGERPLGKQWISADLDARRHDKIDRGWQIRTDHFRVLTNHSRKSAATLALQLETVYRVWQQLFGSFYLSKADLVGRLAGEKKSSGYRGKPFQVVYYSSL